MITEIIDVEDGLTHMETEHEMSHVEEIIEHHDFNEITINSEEEIPHVMFQVDCPSDKSSDMVDDN